MVTSLQSPNDLLAALPSAQFNLLRPYLRTMVLDFGQVLIEAGAPVRQVIFPHSGIVSTLARLQRGETIEVGVVGRDGVVGATSALFGVPSSCAAVVRFSGAASAIDASHFRAVAELSPALREALLRDQSSRTIKAEQTAACNAAHTAEARLCRRLLQSREMAGSDCMLLSQDLMAQMLGVKRNTISLIAHGLQQQGLIRYSRGRMAILDVEGLIRRSCECRSADRVPVAVLPLRSSATVVMQRPAPGSEFGQAQRSPS
ncbi:cyclic nucleotide-binding domain (cNMP-BD) protein [Rhodopseudomonas palustris HaA2]|uniref:Cyclic nucleotide-binding domain (CNMP-BD) protein n=1 Tax=Rhodopseudomonas palustris (strain HaA2) TaxID=316058 RepID=Q2IY54_RHOP2|nr:Crp/Fnr family transcriptional regulator [Rhodopseudomonas palustris]ABD06856.1 cyclic nucleotide-binding domain (cNMP-BD) protein [Rhodopseudomonas palustris HaA2]